MQQLMAYTWRFVLPGSTNTAASIALVLMLGLSQAGPAGGPSALLADLQRDLREQKDMVVKLAEAMPAEKFSYRSTPAQRTYGEQIIHIAVGNVFSMQLLGTTRRPPFTVDLSSGNVEQTLGRQSKAEIIRMLSDSYDYGTAVLAEQTPESINMLVDKNVRFWGGSTRARMVWLLLAHGMDIYGQMVVYVRLNGIVPPASRGI